MTGLSFRIMSGMFRVRDRMTPPERLLMEAGITAGAVVLDYGCGPGSHALAAAAMVGDTGRVFALDAHPLAVARVRMAARRRGMLNIEAIESSRDTGLMSGSVDRVLLYDILHMLDPARGILDEIHRVLKPGEVLSIRDPHMKEGELIRRVTGRGLFSLAAAGRLTYSFKRRRSPEGRYRENTCRRNSRTRSSTSEASLPRSMP